MNIKKKYLGVIVLTFLIISVSQVRAESPPPISLSFPSHSVNQGQSNLGIATISGSNSTTDYPIICGSQNAGNATGDLIVYPECPSGANDLVKISFVEGAASYNTESLPPGTYLFAACDITYYENNNGSVDCTGVQTVQVVATTSTASTSASTTTIPPTKICTITGTVSASGIVTGTVELYNSTTSAIVAGGGGASTQKEFSCGSNVFIWASALQPSEFQSWTCSGAGCYAGTNGRTSFILNNNVTEIANFAENLTISATSTTTQLSTTKQYTTINSGHNSTSSTASTTAYSLSTTLSVTRANTCSINVISSVPGAYRFIVGSDLNGTSKLSANYSNSSTLYMHCGSRVTINIETPPKGYNFSKWVCTGVNCYSGTIDESTFQLDGNVTETAMYSVLASNTAQTTMNTSTTSIAPIASNSSVQNHPVVTPIVHTIDNIWNVVVNFFTHL